MMAQKVASMITRGVWAVTQLQSLWRMRAQMEVYRDIQAVRFKAAARMQSGARGRLARKRFNESKAAILTIQHFFRDREEAKYKQKLEENKSAMIAKKKH